MFAVMGHLLLLCLHDGYKYRNLTRTFPGSPFSPLDLYVAFVLLLCATWLQAGSREQLSGLGMTHVLISTHHLSRQRKKIKKKEIKDIVLHALWGESKSLFRRTIGLHMLRRSHTHVRVHRSYTLANCNLTACLIMPLLHRLRG
ncbi:hypothetical protein BS78_06G075800 [Paspalum vaginatum]|nr:hypothetical protein BS78_06G075800 [Paspalum vaginatum]